MKNSQSDSKLLLGFSFRLWPFYKISEGCIFKNTFNQLERK